MNFLTNWYTLSEEAIVIIVADKDHFTLADELKNYISNSCEIVVYTPQSDVLKTLVKLRPTDLVIALFNFETFVTGGANGIFSPF